MRFLSNPRPQKTFQNPNYTVPAGVSQTRIFHFGAVRNLPTLQTSVGAVGTLDEAVLYSVDQRVWEEVRKM